MGCLKWMIDGTSELQQHNQRCLQSNLYLFMSQIQFTLFLTNVMPFLPDYIPLWNAKTDLSSYSDPTLLSVLRHIIYYFPFSLVPNVAFSLVIITCSRPKTDLTIFSALVDPVSVPQIMCPPCLPSGRQRDKPSGVSVNSENCTLISWKPDLRERKKEQEGQLFNRLADAKYLGKSKIVCVKKKKGHLQANYS